MRSNTRIIACCIGALILCIVPAAAGINATFSIHPDAAGYDALIRINDTGRYDLFQAGMLGERIPLEPKNLTLNGDAGPVEMKNDRGVLTFPDGNYTLRYEYSMSGNSLQMQFPEPARIEVIIPEPYQVGNPLLTSLQPSGHTVEHGNGSTHIQWNQTRSVDIRFYDENQEHLLFIFAQFWFIVAVIMIIPFFLDRRS